MKKLNLESITAGLDMVNDLMEQNNSIARDELIDVNLIDLAEKNTYAADDSDENIRELADSIELLGLIAPLSVVQDGNRYTLIAGERRYKAITQCLHWKSIPCRVFEGTALNNNRRQLMLHEANSQRDLSVARQLEIFEEYAELLKEMEKSGEYKGAKMALIAQKMQISERQVRKYKRIAEQLTRQEKEMLAAGELTVNEASQIATARAKKPEPSSGLAKPTEIKAEPSSDSVEQPGKTEPSSDSVEQPGKTEPSSDSVEQLGKSEPSSDLVEQPGKAELSSGSVEQPGKAEPSSDLVKEMEYFGTLDARKDLLEEIILSGKIWKPQKLRQDYIQQMPTTKEAITKILKPQYNYQGGTIFLKYYRGSYTLTAAKMILEIDAPHETIVYTYTEVDALVRELYRNQKLEGQV